MNEETLERDQISLPRSPNMANFSCIPQEILEKILRFLPLRDKINSGLVCAHWNEVVSCNLQHVTIDASVPYGGKWLEENMKWVGARWEETVPYFEAELRDEKKVWYRDENDPADKEMKNLLSRLCKITNEVKTLDIQNCQLSNDCLAEFFSRQRGLQILRIHANSPASVKDVCFKTIVQGIINHQETIKVIDIGIETSFPDLKISQESILELKDIVCKESLSFPQLKSLKLSPEAAKAFKQFNEDLFLSLMGSNQLEEIGVQYIEPPVSHFIKNGSLRLLKKCCLIDFEIDAEELIKFCPNIVHIDGFTDMFDKTDYDRSILKIMSTFGPQLKHFGCDINCSETMNAILEKCKNLVSVLLIFSHRIRKDEVSLIKRLIPALGCLENLTEIELWLGLTKVEAEIVCEFIEKCGKNLEMLTLQFDGMESFKILNAVGTNCSNLVKLRLIIVDRPKEDEEDPLRTRQLRESGEAVLEGCQNLTTLHLDVCKRTGRTSEGGEKEHIFYDQIGKILPRLQTLTFTNISEYPQSDLIKLIEKLPYCKIGNLL